MNDNFHPFKVIKNMHISEKSSVSFEKNRTIVVRVPKNTNKKIIKYCFEKIFKIKIKKINTLVVKGKKKKYKNFFGRRKDYKKAYLIAEKGQNLKSISNIR
ncbi:50S ribosomal protein L23 [bacterium endosymbiont of Pedicinus badii]|uniref:50S ribosomal protein L23 n=1 Tax=bacterium endosymbiont of Pedicinus badii TaxID=1719126 RepID=UPI0009BB4697|nr:50S ribosomal protein L23 [bacterium endosymbiont of Pedicinus badii]OQM34102.1 hypothetical protein AOQ89_02030 [bacterium endosymbiont of Pedicinus badii]